MNARTMIYGLLTMAQENVPLAVMSAGVKYRAPKKNGYNYLRWADKCRRYCGTFAKGDMFDLMADGFRAVEPKKTKNDNPWAAAVKSIMAEEETHREERYNMTRAHVRERQLSIQ